MCFNNKVLGKNNSQLPVQLCQSLLTSGQYYM